MNYWERVTMKFSYADLLVIREALDFLIADIRSANVDRTSAERLWQRFDAEIRNRKLDMELMSKVIKTLEQQTAEQKMDCDHCIHTRGTFGCCDMVNNEWVYDCDNGKEQFKKQHTAEDCVSREELMDIINTWINNSDDEYDEEEQHHVTAWKMVLSELRHLPSVTPKQKVGKWIMVDNFVDTTCECSSCHYKDFIPKENDISYWIKRKYCPNCGCMMIDEPEMKCEED